MNRIVRLTESKLFKLINNVINEQIREEPTSEEIKDVIYKIIKYYHVDFKFLKSKPNPNIPYNRFGIKIYIPIYVHDEKKFSEELSEDIIQGLNNKFGYDTFKLGGIKELGEYKEMLIWFFSITNKINNYIIDYMNNLYHPDKLEIIRSEKYPKTIYYKKNNEIVMEKDLKNRTFWFNEEVIWSYFQNDLGFPYKQIEIMLKIWLEETLDVTGLSVDPALLPIQRYDDFLIY